MQFKQYPKLLADLPGEIATISFDSIQRQTPPMLYARQLQQVQDIGKRSRVQGNPAPAPLGHLSDLLPGGAGADCTIGGRSDDCLEGWGQWFGRTLTVDF